MRLDRSLRLAAALTICAAALNAQQASSSNSATIAGRTQGMEKRDGFLPVYLDEKTGKILMEVPRDSMRFLMFTQEATGLGSNPIGLDRGGGGDGNVVRIQRAGDRALVLFENWKYRTSLGPASANATSIAESFPPGVMAALPVVVVENGRILVDATDFFVRDWLNVGQRLQQLKEGSSSLAKDRSTVYAPYTKGFPENTEVDIAETFVANGAPGNTVSDVVADGRAFTLRVHYSLVRLPDDGFRPRAADPRIGYFGIDFKDFAQPIQGRLDVHWISKFRLERTDPKDPNSPIKNPIVYYIDPAIPEPMHSASVTGAKFWSEAFDRAGLKGAFVVKDSPRRRGSDGHPLQHRPLDQSQRARLELRRTAHRSAHGRVNEGTRAHGFAPQPHGVQPVCRTHGRRAVARGHALRARPRAPGDGARDRTHARPRAQLHREHVRARIGHGLSGAAAHAGRQGQRGREPGLRDGPRRLRRVGDPLGLRHLPRRERGGFAARDRGRGAEEGIPVSHRPGRAAGLLERSAHEPLGRRARRRICSCSVRWMCAAWR